MVLMAMFVMRAESAPGKGPGESVAWFDELPLEDMICGRGEVNQNKSVEGNPLQMGTKTFARGVGPHAKSLVIYRVGGKAVAFDADVGIDAEAFSDGSKDVSLKFIVRADGRIVAETDVLKDKAESIHLHADLVVAKFDATTGFISGAVSERGECKIEFSVSNAKGSATRERRRAILAPTARRTV